MEVNIKNKLLTDCPYCEENKELFSSTPSGIEDLFQDISNGTQTCYLVSGYRGTGKTSFIEKLKEKFKSEEIQDNDPETIFVHINFSNYHKSKTFILRKLIRGLYLELQKAKKFTEHREKEVTENRQNTKKNKGKIIAHENEKQPILLLESVYEKTFYDTSYSTLESDRTERITSLNVDIKELAKLIIPGVVYLFLQLNWLFDWIQMGTLLNVFALIGSIGLTLMGVFNFTRSINRAEVKQRDFSRKSMYDDEIADYHFYNILKALHNKYNVVFIFDELDKVRDAELRLLLNEIKPYLVSGTASFIVVAGQKLFYEYANSKSEDDAILSSLFSRTIHIPLMSPEELYELFKKILVNENEFTENQKNYLRSYSDRIAFESKLIPRKYISLIRGYLNWNSTESFLNIDDLGDDKNKAYSKVFEMIYKIDEEKIAKDDFNEAYRDYFIMQLVLKSNKIFNNRNIEIHLSEIIGHD